MTQTVNRVLIVEDNTEIREALRAALELEGYSVLEACDGRDALKTLEQQPLPNLILLDLLMPVMDGYEFLAEIKKNAAVPVARIPVIVVSANADKAKRISHLVRDIIPKPVLLDRLLEAVQKAL